MSGPGTTEIVLRQPKPMLGVANASPFCVKLETWLRLSQIPFRVRPVMDPRKAPRGKIPWIEAADGKFGDSGLIIDRLAAANPDLPERLRACTPAQHLVVRTAEESLYWALVYDRWQTDAGFETVREAFFSVVPRLLRPLAIAFLRRQVRKQLWQQGMGRFTAEEVRERARRDVEALAAALGDAAYFAGTGPGRVDCSVYGVLTNILDADPPSPLRPLANAYPNLSDYTARMREAAGFA